MDLENVGKAFINGEDARIPVSIWQKSYIRLDKTITEYVRRQLDPFLYNSLSRLRNRKKHGSPAEIRRHSH